MRFSLYAAIAATASAVYLQSDEDAYADYLWAQHDAGEITHDEMLQLAEEYAEEHFADFAQYDADAQPVEMAETETEQKGAIIPTPRKNGGAQARSDGIIADAKWLGGKALGAAKAVGGKTVGAAKAVGGAIDSAYDATKGAIKSGAKAIYNAPGNAIKAAKDWKKRHNFAQARGQMRR